MALFRTVSFSETMPAVVGDGVKLRAPQSGDYAEWAALARSEPRFPDALGADLAVRRSHAQRFPPAAQAI